MPAVALVDPEAAERAASEWGGQVLAGDEGVRELIVQSKPDLVLNAVVGAAGLGPDRSSPSRRASTSRSPTRRAW